MARRDFKLIVLGLLCGAMIGTLIGEVLTYLLPDDTAVKAFFLETFFEFPFAWMDGNGTTVLDLGIIAINFGLVLRFNVCSIIGFAIAYYLLKYFR
tara:strand:- start:2095 stop:2382 length:288 start_codon:yes stop_codon:yes gene_type:complete